MRCLHRPTVGRDFAILVACAAVACSEDTPDDCTTNAECQQALQAGAGPFCAADAACSSAGVCEFTGNPCTGSEPVCDEANDRCVECSGSEDCPGDGATCEAGACIAPDTTPPVITLVGDAEVTIDCGEAFTDPGVTATDDTDDDVEVTSDADTVVESSAPDSFTVTYTAMDDAGNVATATRAVFVCGDGCGDLGVEPIDFAPWEVVQYEQFSQADANWTFGDTSTVAIQTVNADASILLSPFDASDLAISGTWSVGNAGDDDLMGFVFGYQDRGHFYVFDWKQSTQGDPSGTAFIGMTVKVIDFVEDIEPQDPPDPMIQLRTGDLWPTEGSVNVRPLGRSAPLGPEDDPDCVGDPLPLKCTSWHNEIGWARNVEYLWDLEFHSGVFSIEVRNPQDELLVSWVIEDSTYPSGRFGLYNYSQGGVTYRAFTRELIPPLCSDIIGD